MCGLGLPSLSLPPPSLPPSLPLPHLSLPPSFPIGPHLASQVGSHVVWTCGLNWVWYLGCILASHFGYRGGPWVKLGLGLWTVCLAWSGSQLVPNQQTQLSPNLDMLWICGLNWAWVSGPSTGYKWAQLVPNHHQTLLDPTLDIVWIHVW